MNDDNKQTAPSVMGYLKNKRLEIVIALILLAVSFGLYVKLGRVDMVNAPALQKEVAAIESDNHSGSAADIASLLGPLEAKLAQKPNDANGWALLARSYVEIDQHASSFESFEKAINLIPNDPQLLVDYADAVAMVNGHQFAGKPDALIQQALDIDPDHDKALLLAASSAFKGGNYDQAIKHWTHLQVVLPFDSPMLAEVNASIAEANQLAGNVSKIQPIKKSTVKEVVKESARVEISGMIKIAPHLTKQVSANDTLFIFAKEVNGPPMPIAAVKAMASQLPYIYHLNDTNALNPKRPLSSVKEVVIVARVSKDGDAIPKAGDLQGMSKMMQVGEVLRDIEINEILK